MRKEKCFELVSLYRKISSVNNAERIFNAQMQKQTVIIPTGPHVLGLAKLDIYIYEK